MSEAAIICQGIILDEGFSDSIAFRVGTEFGSDPEALFIRLGHLQPILDALKGRAETYLIERDGQLDDFSDYKILIGITAAESSDFEQDYATWLNKDGTQTKVPIECDHPVLRATVRVTSAPGPTMRFPNG